MNCIVLAQDRGNWRNFVQSVMNFESSTKCRDSLCQFRQYHLLKKANAPNSYLVRLLASFLGTIGVVAKSAYYLVIYVCLSARISAVSTGRISKKFDTDDFFFTNICQDILNLTKFEKKVRQFTRPPKNIYRRRRHRFATKAFVCFIRYLHIVDSYVQLNNTRKRHCCNFHCKNGHVNAPQCNSTCTL